ncbi:MAG: pyruvate, phosphate dikinase [Desulfobacterales bacterium]|nr:pyruvate, phosphate dikinase [Desulfobacterales bacterium]
MSSKALEVNIASSRVNVTVDERYEILQEVMGRYYGVRQGLQAFMKELCHPYKNWEFLVKEARAYALNYLHELSIHPKGPEAARLYIDIYFQAINSSQDDEVKINAADNLLFFFKKLVKDTGPDLPRFLPVLDYGFDLIRSSKGEIFLFIKSFYQLPRLGQDYFQNVPPESDFNSICRLLTQYYRYTYDYWLAQTDPMIWFEEESGVSVQNEGLEDIFEAISHKQLGAYKDKLEEIIQGQDDDLHTTLGRLIDLPGYGQIVTTYNETPQKILDTGVDRARGNQWKLIFLLHIMNIAGLSSIHEENLREINRTVALLIEHGDHAVIQESLEKTFAILQKSIERFPDTALNCVLNMGRGVYRTDDSNLVDFFIDSAVSLGFQGPKIAGVGDDWRIRSNPAHIRNIRTWLQLIGLNPKWSKKLLSSLIINLSLSGAFIRDTDLFPRDITQLLNSDIGPVYNLGKQLARLFPAYFNDIGAEGRLRDISTKIDEVCLRKDPLIHFLRKQSHVESSNQIIGLMEGTLNFWRTRAKEEVMPFVPPEIYGQIETEGPHIDGVHRVIKHLFNAKGFDKVSDLLNFQEDKLKTLMEDVSGVSDIDVKRMELAICFYKLLCQKYRLGFTEIDSYLSRLQSSDLPVPDELRDVITGGDTNDRLTKALDYLEKLKGVILSAGDYEIREDIYRKRHFTVDIPSMYGSYHEMKFDALGLTFRLETLVNVLFEGIVDAFNLEVITRATISRIYNCLRLFECALKLDGISSLEMERQLDLLAHSLEIRGFSATQYLDIFRGFAKAVSNIVNDYFNNTHQENLLKILDRMSPEELIPKYLPPEGAGDRKKLSHRVTEIFLRDRIAACLGLQQLDLFLSRILNTLFRQSHELPGEMLRLLLGSDPQKAITPIYPAKEGISDIIHLGNKGLNLVKMKGYGLPVPPGFIITTGVFRCREIIDHYMPAKKNFEELLALEVAGLERSTGKSLGDPANPLLLSVRSGSSISQPGMLSTFLDVGINEDIVQGLIELTGNEWFGWDTYRRFLQSYGMAFGLLRDDFDGIIDDFKQRSGLRFKKDFSGRQMSDLALAYKSLILDNGIELEETPLEQLNIAIRKVFDSWHVPKAETYRKIMGISDDWGTAVTVQSMVFGNTSQKSGSGVFFTHKPRWPGDLIVLWGDFTLGNQGEDVVSGLVRTLPISKSQAEVENRPVHTALELMSPEIYHVLREWAKELIYNKKWSPQEMEFTFEGPDTKDLYFLQTREMEVRERRKVSSFDVKQENPMVFIGHGIGVSGGAMTGRCVFSLNEIRHLRKKEPGTSLIIVRGDTVPDDIKEIYEADGLLTARGGSTSHAAIVAHRLGKTCVVGCSNLVCMEKEKTCSFDQRGLQSGDWISIDGLEGSVYLGQMKIGEMERS